MSYGEFSLYYDELMQNADYKGLAEYLLELFGRFSGKIPEHGEDDFPRNLQGPTLQVATGGSATFAPELG